MTTSYSPPVNRLLKLGEQRTQTWSVYLKMGFTAEHIPDLIRMMMDKELNNAESESAEVWAPLHAWRTLGALRATDAIEPLLSLLPRLDEDLDDDWTNEELPKVFGLIGETAIPLLTTYLLDDSHGLYARTAAARSLTEIAERHPTARLRCLEAICTALENRQKNSKEFNAYLVDELLDLEAVESMLLIQKAFSENCVEESIVGDWEDAQIDLGLKTERSHPRKKYNRHYRK